MASVVCDYWSILLVITDMLPLEEKNADNVMNIYIYWIMHTMAFNGLQCCRVHNARRDSSMESFSFLTNQIRRRPDWLDSFLDTFAFRGIVVGLQPDLFGGKNDIKNPVLPFKQIRKKHVYPVDIIDMKCKT